jgi:hypothetical protein
VLPEQDAVIAITSGLRDMQAVLNLVWEKLLPAMKPAALPADEKEQAKLGQALKGLKLRLQAGAASPAKVFGKKYQIPANARGVEQISLEDSSADATTLVVKFSGGEARIPCGRQAWIKSRALWGSEKPQAVAASGGWTAADTFSARICFYETPFVQTVTMKFSGDEVRCNGEANVGFGPTKEPELVGKLVR